MTVRASSINWAQLGIELVIVVGGILIALGIDSWWSERNARELEGAFLAQLVVDLQQAEDQLAEEVVGSEQATQAVVDLIAVARGDRSAEYDSIAAWVTLAGWWGELQAPLSTAQALASSENLFVVQNPAVRSGIVRLLDRLRYIEARILLMEERIFDNYGIVNRLIDPVARGQAMYVGVSGAGLEGFAENQDGTGQERVSWDALFNDPEFQERFTDLFWAHENLRAHHQSMLDAARLLREQLEKEISGGAT